MAVNRTQQSGLTIALIIFVMLTFILAATTYFGFTGRQKALDDQAAAEKQATTSANDLRRAQQELETLRTLIGSPPETPVADMETGLAALFEGDFAGFDRESKNYTNLVGWLREEFRDLAGKLKTAEQDKQVLATQSGDDALRIQKELANWKQEAEAAKAAQASQKKDFDTRWAEVEKSKTELLTEVEQAREDAKKLKAIETEIGKGEEYISSAQRESFQDGDAFARLGQLFTLLAENKKRIADLNGVLVRARVADPALQQVIAAARSADDRIDGFDGRVVDVDPGSGTVLLLSRSTAGLRPGLVLHVFAPDDPRPEFASRKAVVQVTEVESSTRARGRIIREQTANPILAEDGVSSSLWSPGMAPAIVVVGFGDVDGDGRSDLAKLTDLIRQAGGRIEERVDSGTAMVVDLGLPSSPDAEKKLPDWPAQEKQRDRALRDARNVGVRIAGTTELLDMLGLDADSFDVGRFPRQTSRERLPPSR